MGKRLVCDTSTGCLDYYKDKYNIGIIRVYLEYQGKVYTEGTDELEPEAFYEKLALYDRKKEHLPKTIPPTIGEICTQFEEYYKQGYDEFIVISLSSALSGVGNTIQLAGDMLAPRIKVRVFDSKIACFSEGYLAIQAHKMVEAGVDTETIIKELTWIRNRSQIFATVGILDFLVYNGRLKGAKAFMGKLLHMCPVVIFNNEGMIEAIETIRTIKKAFHGICKRFLEWKEMYPNSYQYIVYTGKEYLPLLKEIAKTEYGIDELPETVMSPASGCHNGPWLYGLGCIPIRDPKKDALEDQELPRKW